MGYFTRPPTSDDAPAVAELIAACERVDAGRAEMTLEELRAEWQEGDLAEHAVVVVTPGGDVAAYASLTHLCYVRVSVYGYVAPAHRGRGLGAGLVRWGEQWTQTRLERAPAGSRIVVRHYPRATNRAAGQLLESLGYRPVRGVYGMAVEWDSSPPGPEWPEGVHVRDFVPGADEEATFEAYEEASRDMWGRPPSTIENWVHYTRHSDPTLVFIAEEEPSGEIVGVEVCSLVAGRGEVGGLRVRRAWRRRGIGLALLRHAFGEFYRRGAREARLSVDAESPTNAPRLYARAGMHVAENYMVYQKELRVGTDPSQRL